MLNSTYEIYNDLDLHIYSGKNPEQYIVKIINKKLKREKLVTFHASIFEVADIVTHLGKVKEKFGAWHREQERRV